MGRTGIRQEWATPKDFIAAVEKKHGVKIDRDVAASSGNAICADYFDSAQNGLVHRWFDKTHFAIWCNPGFSSMQRWVEKAIVEILEPSPLSASEIVRNPALIFKRREIFLLAPCSPSTNWWSDAVEYCSAIYLLSPRIQFVPPEGVTASSNAHETALIVFRQNDRSANITTWRWK